MIDSKKTIGGKSLVYQVITFNHTLLCFVKICISKAKKVIVGNYET